MKLASFIHEGRSGFGIVRDNALIDLTQRGLGQSLKRVLASGALDEVRAAADAADADLPLGEITLRPPVVNPGKVFCIGVNYRKHVLEMGRDLPEHPWVFTRSPDSFVGHGGHMIRPSVSEQFDFEGELAVVIGRQAKGVAEQEALLGIPVDDLVLDPDGTTAVAAVRTQRHFVGCESLIILGLGQIIVQDKKRIPSSDGFACLYQYFGDGTAHFRGDDHFHGLDHA